MTVILISFLALAIGVWVIRSVRSLSELSHAPRLKISREDTRRDKVSILIPAKNEEKNIADCVRPLIAQLRDDDEVIVINNCSADGTESILKKLGAIEIPFGGTPSDPTAKLKYLNTPTTPEGWTGKNFALHLGIFYAKGNWFLFTDADTRHEPGSVNASIALAENQKLDLLTLLPRCLAHGFWENLIQPCAMGYMGLWFPIRKINDPHSDVYFGNGQYLLIRREHYQRIGGHTGVKEAFLEDFAMMRKTKELKARGLCGFGMDIYGTRMYDSFGALWRGWRRIYLHAFGQDPARILRSVLSVFIFSVASFMALIPTLISGSLVALLLNLFLIGIIYATAFKTHGIVRASRLAALLHPFAAAVFVMILLDAFQMAVRKRPTHWR